QTPGHGPRTLPAPLPARARRGHRGWRAVNSLSEFWQAWDTFEPGVLAAVVVGATLGLVGVYVVLRRLVFLSAAVGQTASLGVVLSLFLTAVVGPVWWVPSPTLGAVTLAFAGTLFVARRSRRSQVFR